MISLIMIGSVTMQSRMDRYYDVIEEEKSTHEYVPTKTMQTRSKKNEELYKEVSDVELDNFDVNSNVSVIGQNTKSINLDEIRDIIERKYHEEPKNKSIGLDDTQDLPEINLSETREYYINKIIEKAKSTKEKNYEEDRLKKLRNTQYDILKSLNLDLKEEKKSSKELLDEDDSVKEDRKAIVSETKDHELVDLINTITTKELIQSEITKELDPLDILSDLKGDDENTKVLGAMFSDEKLLKEAEDAVSKKRKEKEDTTDLDETIASITTKVGLDKKKEEKIEKTPKEDDNIDETEKVQVHEEKPNETVVEMKTTKEKARKLVDTDNVYDDFKDLKDDMKVTRIIVKVLLVLIVLVFIVGCVILGNKFFNWGLF